MFVSHDTVTEMRQNLEKNVEHLEKKIKELSSQNREAANDDRVSSSIPSHLTLPRTRN